MKCCVIMLDEPNTNAKYKIKIQHEEESIEGNYKETKTFSSTLSANKVFYLTEDGIKHYGLDELLKK